MPACGWLTTKVLIQSRSAGNYNFTPQFRSSAKSCNHENSEIAVYVVVPTLQVRADCWQGSISVGSSQKESTWLKKIWNRCACHEIAVEFREVMGVSQVISSAVHKYSGKCQNMRITRNLLRYWLITRCMRCDSLWIFHNHFCKFYKILELLHHVNCLVSSRVVSCVSNHETRLVNTKRYAL